VPGGGGKSFGSVLYPNLSGALNAGFQTRDTSSPRTFEPWLYGSARPAESAITHGALQFRKPDCQMMNARQAGSRKRLK